MNLLLAFIPFVFNSYFGKCECETYYSFLEQAKNAEAIVIGEVISFEEPYYLPGDEPITPDAPNRYSAVMIKVDEVLRGEISEKNIKVFGYSYFSETILFWNHCGKYVDLLYFLVPQFV